MRWFFIHIVAFKIIFSIKRGYMREFCGSTVAFKIIFSLKKGVVSLFFRFVSILF